jgi:indolepyruvate decarboxylase
MSLDGNAGKARAVQSEGEFAVVKVTIGNYLLARLKEFGIAHLFGVPGDFNLPFLEQVLACKGMEWIGTCNELNAAYAADGYARIHGAAALLLTYGVGDLSALNGIAGANAEHVPVVCISGVPPLHAIHNREILHHTSGTGDFEDVMICLRQFTAAQARITPANAAIEIDRLLLACLREKRPVYLQLPSDISYLEIDASVAPLLAATPTGDVLQIERLVELMADRITRAKRPALLVDADAHRFGLQPFVCALGERCGLPFASMSSGRSVFNEQHPLYRGIYAGQASAPEALRTIEDSDCLITIGVRFFDATTGFFSQRIPTPETIVLDPYSAKIDGRVFEGITAQEVLAALVERLPQCSKNARPRVMPFVDESASAECGAESLSHARLWPRIGRFLREGDVVIAECGSSQAGLAGVRLPACTTYISQTTWGSIGYTLPALLGSLLAAPHRRHLLFIGDGSFQMTAQELSTILRQGLNPVIFLINNRGYTIERVIQGPEAVYNDIQNWQYAKLAEVLADGEPVRAFTVKNEAELELALEEAEKAGEFTTIELIMGKLDAPSGLQRLGPKVAAFDFGERGPLRNDMECKDRRTKVEGSGAK